LFNIAVDAVGGDNAPHEIVKGVTDAIRKYKVHITLLGPIDVIKPLLSDDDMDRITLHDCKDVVAMSESPSTSFKRKKNSSIQVGLKLVKEGSCHAFLSAGNTGAVMFTASMILGRLKGIERPAISTILPTEKGPVVMMDMGSSMDCKPSHLSQFSLLGHYFAQTVLGVKDPRVGLLNVGEEKDKGNALTLAAYDEISNLNVNFKGNVEGKEILSGDFDVIVCDGFVGNVVLKFAESVSKLFYNFFKAEAKRSLISLFGLLLLKGSLKKFKKKFDYDEYGGAPLLGVNGVAIIAHGGAKSIAIRNAIKMCIRTLDTNMINNINNSLEG
tara:strand:+ start:204 stop:1187 length:984 start_codon:yes stop_codon:yes gene_type:complete